jgi:hypothetical protein
MKVAFSFSITALLFALAACSGGGTAVPDRAIGRWQVVTTAKTNNNGLCYTVSAPVKTEGTFAGKRGTPYLMATRRASGKIEVSASSGYAYGRGSRVELATDKKAFGLKFKNTIAWAHNDVQDNAIVTAMQATDSAEVRGLNDKGKTTVDIYSPIGFSEALARVRELCP